MNNILEVFTNHTQATWYFLLLASFIGGILASLSPCSLAMLPLIIGYVGGYSKESTFRIFIQLSCLILGTAVVFTAIGIVCALSGKVFVSAFGAYFTLIIASLLMILGLKLLDLIDFEFPILVKSMPTNTTNSIFLYPFLLGVTFALAGTPCSTPILAGIMAFAAIGNNLLLAILMLFLFALGQGLILILAGIFTSSIKKMQLLSRFTDVLLKISGILLITVAIYLYWKVFNPLI